MDEARHPGSWLLAVSHYRVPPGGGGYLVPEGFLKNSSSSFKAWLKSTSTVKPPGIPPGKGGTLFFRMASTPLTCILQHISYRVLTASLSVWFFTEVWGPWMQGRPPLSWYPWALTTCLLNKGWLQVLLSISQFLPINNKIKRELLGLSNFGTAPSGSCYSHWQHYLFLGTPLGKKAVQLHFRWSTSTINTAFDFQIWNHCML